MARPRQKATAETPTRASRTRQEIGIGPGREQGTKAGSWRQTAKTTGPTKPNPFDDIARQVIADQEAKDREAGRDDLIPTLAKSVDRAKEAVAHQSRQLPSQRCLQSRRSQRSRPRSRRTGTA